MLTNAGMRMPDRVDECIVAGATAAPLMWSVAARVLQVVRASGMPIPMTRREIFASGCEEPGVPFVSKFRVDERAPCANRPSDSVPTLCAARREVISTE